MISLFEKKIDQKCKNKTKKLFLTVDTPVPHDPLGRDPYLVSSFGFGVPNCKDSANQEYTRDNDRKGQSISYRCPGATEK